MAATSLAVVVLFAWIGMGLGGWQGGHLFDLTGSYIASYAVATLSGAINLVVVVALIRYVERPQRDIGRPATALR